jgi:hypothetical protein
MAKKRQRSQVKPTKQIEPLVVATAANLVPATTESSPVLPAAPTAEHPAIGRYHEHLFSLYRAQVDSFGKHLVLLSGGALTLSITYLEKIAGTQPSYKPLILLAWACLAVSLLSTLLSMYKSTGAILSASNEYPFKEANDLGGADSQWVARLNKAAVYTVVVGMCFLAVFAFMNLKK